MLALPPLSMWSNLSQRHTMLDHMLSNEVQPNTSKRILHFIRDDGGRRVISGKCSANGATSN